VLQPPIRTGNHDPSTHFPTNQDCRCPSSKRETNGRSVWEHRGPVLLSERVFNHCRGGRSSPNLFAVLDPVPTAADWYHLRADGRQMPQT